MDIYCIDYWRIGGHISFQTLGLKEQWRINTFLPP